MQSLHKVKVLGMQYTPLKALTTRPTLGVEPGKGEYTAVIRDEADKGRQGLRGPSHEVLERLNCILWTTGNP